MTRMYVCPKKVKLVIKVYLFKSVFAQVTTVSIATVLQQDPYLLFYELDRGAYIYLAIILDIDKYTYVQLMHRHNHKYNVPSATQGMYTNLREKLAE